MTGNTVTLEESGIKQLRKPALTRFLLHRTEDDWDGVVAEGVEFETGRCALSWLTEFTGIAIYNSADELITIHERDGRTRIVWCTDDEPLDAAHSL